MNALLVGYLLGAMLVSIWLEWLDRLGALDASLEANFGPGAELPPKWILKVIATVFWIAFLPFWFSERKR